MVFLIDLCRRVPWRPKCRCGNPKSCSLQRRELALAGASWGTIFVLAGVCVSHPGGPNQVPDPPLPDHSPTAAAVVQSRA